MYGPLNQFSKETDGLISESFFIWIKVEPKRCQITPEHYGNVESCRQLKSVDWALQNCRHLKPPKTSTAKP